MSAGNLEIVRQYFGACDGGGLDAFAEFWHPDINWRAIESALDDVGVIRGPDGMRHYYRQWEETFDDIRTEIDELIDGGGEQVLAVVRGIGRMKGSDAEVDIRYAILVRSGTGRSVRDASTPPATREKAFEAAGLTYDEK